ncbi:MAG: Bsp6I family type II restriction endonuclease [Erysipelotrichaceae bacterium]|nr:Bsp6I family type II restriction endonuclease [Erysipelotrichaceae bacterium]
MKKETIKLKDGTYVTGDAFDHNDFIKLQTIFKDWLLMNEKLKSLGGRGLNVPDVFSEAIFCLAFNAIRTNGTAHSYDCVLRETGEGVQVKSASIPNDCTSFGPTSTWDILYFADFASNGRVDGIIKFYRIEDDDVYNLVLNAKKNETFTDQQKQGRRPRFSIQSSIIRPKKLTPVKTINLINGTGL